MIQELKQTLSQRQRLALNQPDRVPAAVLIPFFVKDGCYHLLLTKRTQRVATHKGQICFPGGGCAPEDETPCVTALREAAEEVGLKASDIEIFGQMDDILTVSSNFVVTPFVAMIPYPYHFLVSSEEIEELIEIPLSSLLDPGNFHEEPTNDLIPTCSYVYNGHVVWGATARILRQLLSLLPGKGDVEPAVSVKGQSRGR